MKKAIFKLNNGFAESGISLLIGLIFLFISLITCFILSRLSISYAFVYQITEKMCVIFVIKIVSGFIAGILINIRKYRNEKELRKDN